MALPVIIPPAGVSPIGIVAPVEFSSPAKPPAILADDIDPTTGELRSILQGIHPIDSQVITRARTRRASGGSVQNVGNRFHEIEKVDDEMVTRARYECELAFAERVERRDIRIDDIEVEEAAGIGDGANLFMAYTNLRTGKPGRVRL